MASNPQIISDLEFLLNTGREIEFLTIYKGVPFVFPGRIKQINDEEVRIESDNPAIVSLEVDRKPRILGSDYFEPSVAEVVSLGVINGDVRLKNFTHIGTKLGERKIVRVEPDAPVVLKILSEETEIEGQLTDISISGLGMYLPIETYLPILKPGTELRIQFQLPNCTVDLTGIVLSAIKLTEFYRLSIRFTQGGSQKMDIFKYIADRRMEVEIELQELYDSRV